MIQSQAIKTVINGAQEGKRSKAGKRPEIGDRADLPTDTLIRLAFRTYRKEAGERIPAWEQVQARIFETLENGE